MRNYDKRALKAPFAGKSFRKLLEVSRTLRVAALAIEFNNIALALT